MLEAGEASVEAVDGAIREAGFPMGPFELMDLVGIDVNLAAARGVWEGLGRPDRLRPSPIQERLVEEGRLGRKTGVGFYRYEDGRRGAVAPEFAGGRGHDARAAAIVERIVLAIVDEASLAARRRRRHRGATSTSRCARGRPSDRPVRAQRSGWAATPGLQSRHDPRPPPTAPRGLDRRGRPDADRALRRRARLGPAGRPRGRRHPRRRRPLRDRPGARSRTSSSAARTRPARTTATSPGWPLLLAGLPVEVGGLTVNRLCGSGLQAINSAAHAIAVGDGDVFIGGGVESMTRAPYVMAKPEAAWDRGERELVRHDARLAVRQPEARRERTTRTRWARPPRTSPSAGRSGRDLQDAFALASQQKAVAAIEAGRFDDQIVPITVPAAEGRPDRRRPRRAPARRHVDARRSAGSARRSATAARSRPATLRDQRRRVGGPARRGGAGARARPASRWPGSSRRPSPGVDPAVMGIGPVPATRKALERAGIGVDDLDLVELNEAFASPVDRLHQRARARPGEGQRRTAARSPSGHPLGMSGGRLITMLVHELRRTRRPLRPGDDVHRRRPGDRDGRRADRGVAGTVHLISAQRLSEICCAAYDRAIDRSSRVRQTSRTNAHPPRRIAANVGNPADRRQPDGCGRVEAP